MFIPAWSSFYRNTYVSIGPNDSDYFGIALLTGIGNIMRCDGLNILREVEGRILIVRLRDTLAGLRADDPGAGFCGLRMGSF